MKAIKLGLILMSIFPFKNQAQEIESSAYKLLLKGMLSHSIEAISVPQAANSENAIFVDSREKEEFEVSHIKNAMWVGYDSLDLSRLENVDQDRQIIIYCSVGYRSEKVAEKLKVKGFTNLFNLYGGIFEWKNQGHPVYNTNQKETEQVHAYNKVWGVWLNKGEKVYSK
ncbi:MAG: rhodanese-like domain-containing protein [Vicingaceae bacterium]